jgi:GAF domain
LICEDTETDGRVNREAAKQLGIRSMVVVPIVRKATAVGILEMFAAHPQAFDACDVRMAEVMAGLIQVWLGLRAERSVRQALEAERGSVLQVIEQITPTLEKVLLQQAHPEPAVRDASTAPPGASGGAARVINTSVQALARSLAAYGFWKDDELPGFRGELTR